MMHYKTSLALFMMLFMTPSAHALTRDQYMNISGNPFGILPTQQFQGGVPEMPAPQQKAVNQCRDYTGCTMKQVCYKKKQTDTLGMCIDKPE